MKKILNFDVKRLGPVSYFGQFSLTFYYMSGTGYVTYLCEPQSLDKKVEIESISISHGCCCEEEMLQCWRKAYYDSKIIVIS